jgi:hypothetical protein
VWEGTGHHVGAVVPDRGFASADNSRTLKEGGTFDGLWVKQTLHVHQRYLG